LKKPKVPKKKKLKKKKVDFLDDSDNELIFSGSDID